MPAASEPLHYDLDVDLTERSGADPDQAVLPHSDHERSFDSRHVQQRIRRLRDKQLLDLLAGIRYRYRDAIPIGFRVPNNLRLTNVFFQILFQHPLNEHRIRAVAAQEGRGLERARARAESEALRVDGNSREQCRGFPYVENHALMDILQKLRDELACRGSVRFHIDEYRIVDELLASAMVIHDHDPFGALQQPRLRDHRRAVSIDDDR